MKKHASSTLYTRFKSAPKYLRVSTYLLLAYAAYAIIVGLIAPTIIESQGPKQLRQLLGREVKIEKVSINPFLLKSKINNVSVLESDQQQVFSQFQSLEIELNFWRSLLTLTPTIEHATMVGPMVRIAKLSDGDHPKFNFSDILRTLAQKSAADTTDNKAQSSDTGQIPAFRINHLSLSQGSFRYTAADSGADLHYQDLTLALDNIDSQAYTLSIPANDTKQSNTLTKSANQYALTVQAQNAGNISLSGQFQLSPLEVKGDLTINQLPLVPYWPFVQDQIAARLTDGTINFVSQYHALLSDDALSYQANQARFELLNLAFSDQQAEKIKLPSLVIDKIGLSSDSQTVTVADITMQGLWTDAALKHDGLDLATLFSPQQSHSQVNEPSQPKTKIEKADNSKEAINQPWLVTLNQFEMTGSDFNLKEDVYSPGVHWRVHPMSLKTGQIRSDLVNPIDYNITAAVSSGTQQQPEQPRGTISTQGSIDTDSLFIDGNLDVNALDLTQIQPYLTPYLNIKLTNGALSTQGDYKVNGPENIHFDGSANIANLSVRDPIEREPLIKWNKMSIDSLRFDSQQNQLLIKTILLDKPYAKIMITEDQQTNIGQLIVTQENSAQANTSSKQVQANGNKNADKPMSVIVQHVQFKNGSAFFADNSLTPNFASGIELLEGSINNLSSTAGTKASVDIEGKIDKYAPVTLKGEINPLAATPYLDLALVFRSVELTSINPYSGTYAGYYIDKGQLSLDLNYQLENNHLIGTNHVVVDQLQLGKPSDSSLATSLPITLAVAILQDRHGVIDLGVDVSGDVDDPEFSFGGVVLQAFANVITKAVTAPFSLLANLVGSDDELNEVNFAPGTATLDDEEKQRIEKLAQALAERPILKVNVEGSVLATDDSYALAEQQIQQLLLTQSGIDSLPEPFSASRISDSSPLIDALEELAQTQLQIDIDVEEDKVEQQLIKDAADEEVSEQQLNTVLHMGLYNQLVSAINIDQNTLSNLAANRAKAVKAFLVEEQNISPDRVFLLDSKTELNTAKSGAELTITAE